MFFKLTPPPHTPHPTHPTHTQKDRVELQRTFGSWKLRHCDEKREEFTVTLARKYHQHKVKGRVWGAWFGAIQSRWRQKLEKACQVSVSGK